MGKLIFTKLNHPADQCFTCGNSSIDKKVADSYFLTLLDRCYAYEVTTESGVIVAYYQIQFKRFPIDRFPEPIDEYSLNSYVDLYAMHIEYLAVRKEYQYQKIGSNVLKHILAKIIMFHRDCPFRLVTINALNEKVSWYQRAFGFKEVDQDGDDPETTLMMIDLLSAENLRLLKEYEDIL